jgi:tetratricopeptide (TPR) repeat protein
MNAFRLFAGKTPERIEQSGDAFFDKGELGAARLEYEKALEKLKRKTPDAVQDIERVQGKIVRSGDALALKHMETADALLESEDYDEAVGLLRLGLDLTQDTEVAASLERRLAALQSEMDAFEAPDMDFGGESLPGDVESARASDEDHYFTALVSALPPEELDAYMAYGARFRDGYVRLNQGDFEAAAELLSLALEENSESPGFIPLELATAHINLGRDWEARLLLEGFLDAHPESVRAFQQLCEIYWENRQFDQARRLLSMCPETIEDAPAVHLLKGETFFREGRLKDAESQYLDYVRNHPWHEGVALALARTFEALGEAEKARDLYAQAIGECQGCGKRVDPRIKQRFADTSLETGDHSTRVLELYLSLIQEIPQNRSGNYLKISRIYELNGNDEEARRFKAFAEGAST